MIEIIHPGWLSLIVDEGRYGHADSGVPPSAALDSFAYKMLNVLLKNPAGTPAIEVMGKDFSLQIHADVTCALTGARVEATLNGEPLEPWTSFCAQKGSILKVKAILEGFRYYVGFSGKMDAEWAINSFSTNLECRFGGFKGRPFVKGDRVRITGPRMEKSNTIHEKNIPGMKPPHVLRFVEGPEMKCFSRESLGRLFEKEASSWYNVSSKSNRTGIRLEGEPLAFKEGVEKSIVSEGILPGTIQIPGDGLPIIMLHERTIGGYARLGVISRADRDLLAHLKPGDKVTFEMVEPKEAEQLWNKKAQLYDAHTKTLQEVVQ
jgi:biotin-dependent carboxylase-like uncharacterized protein